MADVLPFPPPPGAPPDTVLVLEKLLADARDNRLIFIAYVAEYQRTEYVVDTAGTAHAPRSIRRMLGLLKDKLA